jgi:hypothetical protein
LALLGAAVPAVEGCLLAVLDDTVGRVERKRR